MENLIIKMSLEIGYTIKREYLDDLEYVNYHLGYLRALKSTSNNYVLSDLCVLMEKLRAELRKQSKGENV